MSEFFADELALTLNCARASASALTEHALTLTRSLAATLGEPAQGRLDWPRARTIAAELGRPARDTDPQIVAAVEAAVLPDAASLSIRRLKAGCGRSWPPATRPPPTGGGSARTER